ncbi:MAG TPA: hypothetical protein VLA49_01710 [Anaerolineales bacterium]|nr:hypothetical protein [Anaerolineales bacterium]
MKQIGNKENELPALSHVGLGLAAKRVIPKIPVLVLVGAALALDALAGLFWLAGVIHIISADHISWSHGLFFSVIWSLFLDY